MRRVRRARRLSLTSLIDVIFLLLLFFMLSSTFTRFGEVDLASTGAGSGAGPVSPLFLQLAPDALRLNGQPQTLATLAGALGDGAPVLVSLAEGVTAQRLTDLLVALRAVPGLQVTVLGDA